MEHKETCRLSPGAKTAVLFIHGICGTPNHFRDVLPLEHLVPDDWSIRNLCLPGHGGDVSSFGKSSMAAWKAYAWEEYRQLAESHERIILVGHSMGTLFSLQMAMERPEKVAGLFLIAVPLRLGIKAFGVLNLLRLTFDRLDADDPIQNATQRVSGITTTWMVWKYIPWIPRMWELLREMHGTAKRIGGLNVPCVALQSERDELVSNRSRKVLESSGRLEVHNLLRSTHFYYSPEEIATVQKRFLDMIKTAGS